MKKSWQMTSPVKGKHNVVFQMISTSEELPDGIAMIKEINLQYGDESVANAKEIQRLKQGLKELRHKADHTPIMK